jgi:ferredoxin--NADP+ reductase
MLAAQGILHQILFATGAQTDRRMGIPGEDLSGSHPATEFVAWYNGHPDYRDRQWNLEVESAAVVGVGNVAVDVARLLCLTRDELWASDAADYAVELWQEPDQSREFAGPARSAQAAFSTLDQNWVIWPTPISSRAPTKQIGRSQRSLYHR